MSHIYSHQQTTTPTTPEITVASLANARKLANKERRKIGRERHEERKEVLKTHECDRRWERKWEHHEQQRQEKRPEDGSRAFAGRNLDNHRNAGASHLRGADTMTAVAPTHAAKDGDYHQHHHLEDEEEAYETEEDVYFVPVEEEKQATSGAMLLAMARPAKTRRRRRPRCSPVMTDGEMFEVVEVDGRLVALDEDGWEILPDENADVSLLYSDIVRGIAL